MHRLLLLLSMALFGAAVAVLPGLATATSSVTAQGTSWVPQQSGAMDNSNVTFSNPQAGLHDVHFVDGPNGAAPSCTTPTTPTQTTWTGTCSFGATEGAYIFICDQHGHWDPVHKVASGMWGTVYVNPGGTTPTTTMTTPTGTTTTTPTTTTTTYTTPTTTGTTTPGTTPTGTGPSAGPGAAASSLQLPTIQRGPGVKGTVTIASGGSDFEADLLGSTSQLARSVVVGKTVRHGIGAGKVSFRVTLNKRGRAALKRRHRLALKLVVTVSGPGGARSSLSRSVTLRS